jgi:hypothetical protein
VLNVFSDRTDTVPFASLSLLGSRLYPGPGAIAMTRGVVLNEDGGLLAEDDFADEDLEEL